MGQKKIKVQEKKTESENTESEIRIKHKWSYRRDNL